MSAILAPFDGAILALSQFDDPVFKDELVGSGIGLRPSTEIERLAVHSPITGTVIKIMPHAFIVLHGDRGVLVHIGIDTVSLHGEGFTRHIEEGQEIEAGQLCFEVDATIVRSHGLALDTPIVVMDSPKGAYASTRNGEVVHQGDVLFELGE
ncbi:PTS sugar transporter subunit IIA [Stomatohabitans albus]|uniref:PTS sugar transporter subunit IIA n=1 Tax=Stomatohabitans albus TaxID=3110766 RepID=UPI00300CC4C2